MLIRKPQIRAESASERTMPLHELESLLLNGSVDECIHALGQFNALPESARAVAMKRLAMESDTRLQQVILNHLVADVAVSEVPSLLDLLTSEQASLRNQVIDALAQIQAGDALTELMSQLEARLASADPDVRILSLNLVAALERPALLPAVSAVMREDDNINVCMTALDTLVVLGTAEEWPLVEALSERFPDDPFAQFGVGQARRALLGDG